MSEPVRRVGPGRAPVAPVAALVRRLPHRRDEEDETGDRPDGRRRPPAPPRPPGVVDADGHVDVRA